MLHRYARMGIKDILDNLHKSLTNKEDGSYLYDILYNQIGLDNIDNIIGIITFNYDLVIEKIIDYIKQKNYSKE